MKHYSRVTAETTKNVEVDQAEGEPTGDAFGVTWICLALLVRRAATAFALADFKHQPSLQGPQRHAAGVLLSPTPTERANPNVAYYFPPTVAPKAFLPRHR